MGVVQVVIGLYDADGKGYPNLALMKISAWHKAKGDQVEWANPLMPYDKVYVARVFGDEYTQYEDLPFNAKEVEFGGTGFAITIEDGKEVYHKDRDKNLPYEVEHMYPDYDLYGVKKAMGFLTRGCPNNCPFCIVSKKEGRKSVKVADLSEFWRGQKEIEIYDPNILACKDRMELLRQLADSKALVDFNQGLDARFITDEVADVLKDIKLGIVHFAFDLMQNKERIVSGLQAFKRACNKRDRECIVYILTNYNTTFQEDMERIQAVRELGFSPDVRIYRKSTAPQITKDLQRWCNNRQIFQKTEFADYVARGRSMREQYETIQLV